MFSLFLCHISQEAPEIKSALEKFASVAGGNDSVPLTSEQVTEFAKSLDANSDGKVRVNQHPEILTIVSITTADCTYN